MQNYNLFRAECIYSIYKARSGHPGGCLSCTELIVSILKHISFSEDGYQINNRFILSKGHAAPMFYVAAANKGLVSKSELKELRKIDSILQGHVCRNTTPWVEASTGSLGQGMSYAIGLAKGLKMQKSPQKVFALIGDGECQEGQIWEGAMFAAHHDLSNLGVFLDYNKLQSDDLNSNIMNLEPLLDKFSAFGWDVLEIDGHNLVEINSAIEKFQNNLSPKPMFIMCHTIKGKGVSFMENAPLWHGSVTMSDEQFTSSINELGFDQKLFLEKPYV